MIVVHHLNESRSQRVLWLLEELGAPYEIKFYQRDAKTRLAPPELTAVHPLGKSPVISDGDRVVHESGAIVDYILTKQGKGRLRPAFDAADYPDYLQWLHYAEGSAMLPLMLLLYTARLGEAAKPLQPRIDSEIANHLSFIDNSLAGRDFLVGNALTGADIQMSFVPEVARAFNRLAPYANISRWIDALHARPAYKAALAKGGPYSMSR